MTKTPQLKPKQVIKALGRLGFEIARVRGSHVRLSHPDGRKVTVPKHRHPIFVGTLHSILHQAEISLKELLEYL